jgi:hypothetical protein
MQGTLAEMQLESHTAAEWLLDLIGKDPVPAVRAHARDARGTWALFTRAHAQLRWFPVIVVFCIVNLNSPAPGARTTMHQVCLSLRRGDVCSRPRTAAAEDPQLQFEPS